MHSFARLSPVRLLCVPTLTLLLGACGGGSGTPTPATYTLSGGVTGLTATGLVLSVNGSNVSVPSGASSVSLASGLATGTAYTVTIGTQPGGESCSVKSGSGTIEGASVSSVLISCAQIYSLNAAFTHLHASGLTLSVNGSSVAAASSTTSLVLISNLTTGSSYSVSISKQPANQWCTVANGTGTISTSDVSVTVNCPFTLLYDFNASGGEVLDGPGSLLLGTDGNLYGIASGGSGGAAGGALFEYNLSSQQESVLWKFSVSGGGFGPTGTLALDFQNDFEGVAMSGGANGAGTIFVYNPVNRTEADLASFSASTGASPVGGIGPFDNVVPGGGLTPPPQVGNLGLASQGGAYGYGTIYDYESPTVAAVYSFAGGSDGSSPVGRLVYDANTNMVYGLTSNGGTFGLGTLFAFQPSTKILGQGTESVLHAFAGGASDGAFPEGSLILAPDGNLYGLTSAGGIGGDGVIFEYNMQTHLLTVLYSFEGGTSDGSAPDGTLLKASDGNFYGMTSTGGQYNQGTVFVYNPTSGTEAVLYSFGMLGNLSNPAGYLIDDGTGNLYGVTAGGGSGDAGIFEYQIN